MQRFHCGADCEEDYSLNQIVSLTATPSADYIFSSWQGCALSTTNSCRVTMDMAKIVTAIFAAISPEPDTEMLPECVVFHSIYSMEDRILSVPFFEIPMVAIIDGMPVERTEAHSMILKLLNGSDRFQLKTVDVPIVEENANCTMATYDPDTGSLYLPYLDIPIVTKIGNKLVETQRAIFQALFNGCQC